MKKSDFEKHEHEVLTFDYEKEKVELVDSDNNQNLKTVHGRDDEPMTQRKLIYDAQTGQDDGSSDRVKKLNALQKLKAK